MKLQISSLIACLSGATNRGGRREAREAERQKETETELRIIQDNFEILPAS